MTLKEAIKLGQNKMAIDYSGMTEEEVEELDTAIDKVFEAAIKYSQLVVPIPYLGETREEEPDT